MKTHILSVGLALAVVVLAPLPESRLLAQEPDVPVDLLKPKLLRRAEVMN